jgi:hypothetical protein
MMSSILHYRLFLILGHVSEDVALKKVVVSPLPPRQRFKPQICETIYEQYKVDMEKYLLTSGSVGVLHVCHQGKPL